MKHIIQTIKYSLRLCVKAPTNTLLCIFVLAGSIALVASMFRLCNMAFFWEFPYKNSDRIVMLECIDQRGGHQPWWTFKTVETIVGNDRGDMFSQLIPAFKSGALVRIGEKSGSVGCAYLAWDFEKTFGVKPLLGRTFTENDAHISSDPVVLISEKYWRKTFNSAPDIIGKTILVERTSRTIVGVMPEVFDFPTTLSTGVCEMWMPFDKEILQRDADWITTVNLYGVLKEGVSISNAERRFNEEVLLVIKALPEDNKYIVGGAFKSLNGNYMPDGFQTMIQISAACSLLVLIMGCGIVSGLLTARYSARVQELAIRSALGASRSQIVGQIIVEFSLISGISVALGLLLETWLETIIFAKYYDVFALPSYARGVDPVWACVFVAGVMCIVTLVSAIMPALRASQIDVSSVMRESTRTGSSLRITKLSNFLIASQVAMTCIILTCGLMVGLKIRELHTEEKYFNPFDYMCAIVALDPASNSDQRAEMGMQIMHELESNPEVEKAGISTELYNNASMQWGCETKIWIDGQTYEDDAKVPTALYRVVSPGYFNSINVPIIAGRDFTYEDDRKHPNVAAVTDAFALKHFGTMDVLGKTITMWGKEGARYTIIAIVPDLYNSNHEPNLISGFFVPYSTNSWGQIPIYMKGRGAPELYEKVLSDAILKTCPRALITRQMNMGAMKDQHGWGLLLQLIFTFFSAFAVSALVLSAAGLYGVIAFSVNLRKVEMGIRLSLGANPLALAMHIARRGMAYTGIGLTAGAMGVIIARHFLAGMTNQFYDGWEVYVMAFLSIIIISIIAVMVPATRGSSMEPATALREE